jgi:hypothetical protein
MTKQDIARLKRDLINEKSEPRKKALNKVKTMSAQEALPLLAELLSCKNDDVIEDITRVMLSYKDEALPLKAGMCASRLRKFLQNSVPVL